MAATDATVPLPRLAVLDIVRGVAVLTMVVYHFAWDLTYCGLIPVDVGTDTGWRWFAHIVAGTFLALVGVGLVLSTRNGLRPRSYFRRLGVIVAAALGVSVVTRFVFPDEWVHFGILHAIAVASVLGLPFVRAPIWATTLAAVAVFAARYFLPGAEIAITAPNWTAFLDFDALFGRPEWWWVGLARFPGSSVDFVPVFPWFGATLIGIGLARIGLALRPIEDWARIAPAGRIADGLALAGRWSLVLYLVHQPLLFGALYPVAAWFGPSEAARAAAFTENCRRSCAPSGFGAETCANFCTCVTEGLSEVSILDVAIANSFTAEQRSRWMDIVAGCRPAQPGPAPPP